LRDVGNGKEAYDDRHQPEVAPVELGRGDQPITEVADESQCRQCGDIGWGFRVEVTLPL
jgi:hypothetical protein